LHGLVIAAALDRTGFSPQICRNRQGSFSSPSQIF
jgi:hypothetical protein